MDRKNGLKWLAVCSLAAGASYLYFGGLLGKDAGRVLADVCEPLIKSALRSPSSFDLVDVVRMDPRPAVAADLRNTANTSAERASIHEVIISYDAANAYGTPVRNFASCTIIADPGETLDARMKRAGFTLDVKVDGQNLIDRNDRLIESLR